VTGTFKAIGGLQNGTAKVRADGRYRFQRFVVTVDKEFVLIHISECIHGKIGQLSNLHLPVPAGRLAAELPQETDACYDAGCRCQHQGGSLNETSSFHISLPENKNI
jgi:hypothetical protein